MSASAPNHDETIGQIVDTPSALEFMHEALEKITEEELTAIVAELRYKSQRFHSLLAPDALPTLDETMFRSMLRSVFSTRRRVPEVFAHVDAGSFRDAVGELLHGTAPLEKRFDAFCAQLEPLNLAMCCDLAGEC